MKPKLLSLFFTVFLFQQLVAQTDFRFADSTGQWNVLQVVAGTAAGQTIPDSTIIYQVVGDTAMRGKQYQNIDQYYFRRDSIDRIYEVMRWDTSEYLIYDFGKNANDSILVGSSYPGDGTFCFVDSVDSVFIGHIRKRMYIRYGTDYALAWPDIWIDGIGALYNNFLYPEEGAKIPEGPFDTLLCYFGDNQLEYHNSDYDTCFVETPTGIREIIPNQLKLSPNPVTDNLVNIQFDESPPPVVSVKFFDLTGRIILQEPLTGKMNRIALNGVAKGMYLYTIISPQQIVYSGKLIIQ